MKLVDLYSGTGGFSTGAHRAGLSVHAAIDVDPILTSSFAYNFPNTKLRTADLSEVSGAEIEQLVGGRVDGVFGGPPCQGFSSIGRRDINDPRRLLLGHFFRLVDELRPSFFVMENVVGLGQGEARLVLDAAVDSIASKYDVLGPLVLDAADYGAATKRKRVFMIGYDPVSCDPLSLSDIEDFRAPSATVKEAISDLADGCFVCEDEDGFDVWELPAGKELSTYATKLRSENLMFTGHRLTNHSQAVSERFKTIPQGGIDNVGRHPRLSWTAQCPTLRAGTGSDKGSYQSVRPIHPELPRVITVREAARLQGFSDEHRFHSTIWHSFRMIGNSVSPFVAEAIFRAMKRVCVVSTGSACSASLEAAE